MIYHMLSMSTSSFAEREVSTSSACLLSYQLQGVFRCWRAHMVCAHLPCPTCSRKASSPGICFAYFMDCGLTSCSFT